MAKWQSGDSWLHYDYRQDISYVYINIPKNASCWMKENFGGYLYDWHTNMFKESVNSAITVRRGLTAIKRYVVILREPIDRWITGFAQSFWGWDLKDPRHYLRLTPDQWLDLIPTDDHTRSQCEFLQGLDHSSTTWFDCDDQLTERVRHWMSARFDHVINTPGDAPDNGHNISAAGQAWPTTGVTQQSIIDHVRQVLAEQPTYLDRLHAIYQPDHDLRKSVEFYGSR